MVHVVCDAWRALCKAGSCWAYAAVCAAHAHGAPDAFLACMAQWPASASGGLMCFGTPRERCSVVFGTNTLAWCVHMCCQLCGGWQTGSCVWQKQQADGGCWKLLMQREALSMDVAARGSMCVRACMLERARRGRSGRRRRCYAAAAAAPIPAACSACDARPSGSQPPALARTCMGQASSMRHARRARRSGGAALSFITVRCAAGPRSVLRSTIYAFWAISGPCCGSPARGSQQRLTHA